MINFIDEERIVEELFKNPKTISKDTKKKLPLLVKYYKKKKKTKKEIRNELDDFMYKNYEGFVMADWDSEIQKATNKYTKPDFREFLTGKDINITYEELNFIKEKQDLEIEKLLFILLVLAKSSFNEKKSKNLWVNVDSAYLFKLAKWKYDKNKPRMEQRELKISDLSIKGLLIPKAFVDSNDIKLLYGISKKGNGIDFKLDDKTCDDIVYHYLKWRGDKNIKECEVCGCLIKQTIHNKKYCEYCAKAIKMNKDREYQKENYKNYRKQTEFLDEHQS